MSGNVSSLRALAGTSTVSILGQQHPDRFSRLRRLPLEDVLHYLNDRGDRSIDDVVPNGADGLQMLFGLAGRVLLHVLLPRNNLQLHLPIGNFIDDVDDLPGVDRLLGCEEHDLVLAAATDHDARGSFTKVRSKGVCDFSVCREQKSGRVRLPVYEDGEGFGVDTLADGSVGDARTASVTVASAKMDRSMVAGDGILFE